MEGRRQAAFLAKPAQIAGEIAPKGSLQPTQPGTSEQCGAATDPPSLFVALVWSSRKKREQLDLHHDPRRILAQDRGKWPGLLLAYTAVAVAFEIMSPAARTRRSFRIVCNMLGNQPIAGLSVWPLSPTS